MKNIYSQLSLFDTPPPDYDQILTDKANGLLDLLNDDRKDKYQQKQYAQVGNYIVLIAENKHKDKLFNVLDIYGNIPPDFSVNWRTAQHVRQELNIQLSN
jgi:hypothetical protein